jgi:hypothetical protein
MHSHHAVRLLRIAALLILLLGTPSPRARADFQTEPQTLGFVDKPTDFDTTLAFNKFDTMGGTRILDSVQLTVNDSMQSTVTIRFTTTNTNISVSLSNASTTVSAPSGFTLGLGGAGNPDQLQVVQPDFTMTRSSPPDLSQVFSQTLPMVSKNFNQTYTTNLSG